MLRACRVPLLTRWYGEAPPIPPLLRREVVYGIVGQTVAGLVSAGGAVLVWTGLALAWRRLRRWRQRSAEALPKAA